MLCNLTREELELAMKVVDEAWTKADGPYVQLEVPEELQHLGEEDWEAICNALTILEMQQADSLLH
jgi:hypothetical protein